MKSILGVGSAAAIEIGRRLAALAQRLQVIVITHSAQVAAFATTHLLVTKTGNLSDVCSCREKIVLVRWLGLSGLHDSERIEHSRELLAMAAREMRAARNAGPHVLCRSQSLSCLLLFWLGLGN